MGQKINPIIFRLGKKTTWKSKYFEKKNSETALLTYKDLEIKKFIQKFFSDNGLIIHDCKVQLENSSLHIFISYYLTMKSVLLINSINKQQNVKLIKKKKKYAQIKNFKSIKKTIINFKKYQAINYNNKLNKTLQKKYFKNTKQIIQNEKNRIKFQRISILKAYKKSLMIQKYKQSKNLKINSFLYFFFESLHKFFKKKTSIFLTLQHFNKNIKQNINVKNTKLLKKSLVNVKKYKQNQFFKEGVNVLFLATTQTNSANLLSQFISSQLSLLKRHNFFFKFLKTTLNIFKNSPISNVKGFKIKIKGRLNGAPRAKHKIITIGEGVPVLSLDSKIDYAENTAFTSNGTLGIKVWINEKK